MIQVLIIELILGRNATHKIYDTSLNQAILYRLVSLMNVSDPNKTLQRAFLSLFTQAEFDADTAKRLGEVLGVPYIIYGNIIDVCEDSMGGS